MFVYCTLAICHENYDQHIREPLTVRVLMVMCLWTQWGVSNMQYGSMELISPKWPHDWPMTKWEYQAFLHIRRQGSWDSLGHCFTTTVFCIQVYSVFSSFSWWNGKKLALTLMAMRTLFALFGEHHTLSCIGKVLRHLIPYKTTRTSPFIWLLCCTGSYRGALSARLTLATSKAASNTSWPITVWRNME